MKPLRQGFSITSKRLIPFFLCIGFYCLPSSAKHTLQEKIASQIWYLRLFLTPLSSPYCKSDNEVAIQSNKNREDSQISSESILHAEKKAIFPWMQSELIQEKVENKISKSNIESIFKEFSSSSLITASVIFQESAPYGTAIWIDKGKKSYYTQIASSTKNFDTNLNSYPIERNCPVICQGFVVGCIDYVGEYVSRVMLINDPKLSISVRIKRAKCAAIDTLDAGLCFRRALQRYIVTCQTLHREKVIKAQKAITGIMHSLAVSEDIAESNPNHMYFAKGLLRGATSVTTHTRPMLEGSGFTCDFEDSLSKKRDLRTGQNHASDEKIAIVKPGDILQTTGLDAIFPRGLQVAQVSSVTPLVEGASSYTLQATPILSCFPNMEYVSVLPKKLGYIESTTSSSSLDRILAILEETELQCDEVGSQ